MNQEGVIGAELLIDPEIGTVQFYSLTSSLIGYGRRIVYAVVHGTLHDWNLGVVMDWNGGFWEKMTQEYRRIIFFFEEVLPFTVYSIKQQKLILWDPHVLSKMQI